MHIPQRAFVGMPTISWAMVPKALLALLTVSVSALRGDTVDPDPTRFEADIVAFKSQDAEEPPIAGSVLFLGSSSIRLWPLGKSFPDLPTVNRGFGGSHFSDAVYFADRILARQEPGAFVVYSGDNDIESGKSPRQVADDCQRLLLRLRRHAPKARIVVLGIKPSPSRWERFSAMQEANGLIRAHVEQMTNAEWVDVITPMLAGNGQPCCEFFVEDCLHLSEEGYRLWSCLAERAMRREPLKAGS